MLKRLLVLITFFWALESSFGDEIVEYNTNVRALGMGNAYTTVVEDKNALFYNPGALAKIKGLNLTIADPYLGANGQEVVNTVRTNSSGTNSNFATTLRSLYGKNLWVGGGAQAALAVPGLAVSIYDSADFAAYMSNPAFPNLNFRFFNDYGIAAGVGFDIVPKVFQFGLSAQRITRSGGQFPIGVSTLGTLNNQDIADQVSNSGTAYAANGGLLLTVPTPVKPTFSFVWKNMGMTTFTKDSGSVAPPIMVDEMILGFGLDIDLSVISIRPTFDAKHINIPNEQLGKKLHMGLELDLPLLAVRAGLNQGYYTLGFGVDLAFVRLDAATYGVELGEYPGQKEDRRYVVQLTMELGFDPSSLGFLGGSSSGGGGKRPRGIKQRR